MEHPLQRLWNKPERLVIGFMSGTSADGVDAALVRISGYGVETRLTQLAFCFTPFDEATRAEVLRLAGGGSAAAADFCRINFHLGQLYCEAGDALCRQAGIERAQVDLIGCHGQTLWHIPQEEIYLGRSQHSTFQLGESAMLAEYFVCPMVGDFRVRDVAAGGLGAPRFCSAKPAWARSMPPWRLRKSSGGIGRIASSARVSRAAWMPRLPLRILSQRPRSRTTTSILVRAMFWGRFRGCRRGLPRIRRWWRRRVRFRVICACLRGCRFPAMPLSHRRRSAIGSRRIFRKRYRSTWNPALLRRLAICMAFRSSVFG